MEEQATATVRTASGELARLLRRRGVTRDVGKAMRRALQNLDEILEGRSNELGLLGAIAELRGCLQLIQDSANPADHQLTEGVAAALSRLFPLESTQTEATPVDSSATAVTKDEPHVLPRAPTTSAPPLSRRAVAAHGGATDAAIGSILRNLPRLHDRRLACVADPTATVNDLQGAELAIRRATLSLDWSAARAKQLLHRSLAGQLSDRNMAASVLGLVHLDPDADPVALSELLRKAPARPEIVRAMVDGFRLSARRPVSERIRAIFGALNTLTRAAVVPWLVDEGRISWEGLLELAEDSSDEVATAAVSALAWCPIRSVRTTVFDLAVRSESRVRAEALLCASTAHGEHDALVEIRRRADRGACGPSIIDALAVAGDESDVPRLLQMSGSGWPSGREALLAAAHLGSLLVLRALESDDHGFGAVLAAQARRAILGDGPPPPTDHHHRLIRGTPWTVPAAVGALAAPDETPIRLLRWSALELPARTGEPAPCVLDIAAPLDRLVASTGVFVASFANVERAGIGRWLYGRRLASRAGDQAPRPVT